MVANDAGGETKADAKIAVFTEADLLKAVEDSENFEGNNPYLLLRLPQELRTPDGMWRQNIEEEEFHQEIDNALEARKAACIMTGPGGSALKWRLEHARSVLCDPFKRGELDRTIEERKKDGSLKVLRFDNALYEGGVITGSKGQPIRHGKGVTVCTNGEKYEGEYNDGLRSGFGINFWSSGDYYCGQWNNDCMDGNGILVHHGGSWYMGSFCEGVKHGSGHHEWSNGDTYKGGYVEGQMCGYGVMRYTDGGVYEGQWADGQEHGEGTFTHPLEGTQTGHWREGVPYGPCEQKLQNGDTYKGDVHKGVREGEGEYVWAAAQLENAKRSSMPSDLDLYHAARNQMKYNGTFKRDMIHGKGAFMDGAQGVTYEGTWRDHLPEGEGNFVQKMNRDANFQYEGGFSRGKRHGHGVATWPNGTTHTGDWHRDLRHGNAVIQWSDGNSFKGTFDSDERHGLGTYRLRGGHTHTDRYARGVHRERDDTEVEQTQVPQSADTTLPPQSAGAMSFAESNEFDRGPPDAVPEDEDDSPR